MSRFPATPPLTPVLCRSDRTGRGLQKLFCSGPGGGQRGLLQFPAVCSSALQYNVRSAKLSIVVFSLPLS